VVLESSKAVVGSIMPFIGKNRVPCTQCFHGCNSFLIKLSLDRFWNNYSPEPHILLFRRPLGTDPQSGRVDQELVRAAREEYKDQFGLRV
jgi:hypothetical protein